MCVDLPDILGYYTHILQAQLITAKGNPRTWFVTQEGRQYVVKGPLPEQERKECMKSQRLKEILGIPHTYIKEDGEFLTQNCIRDYTELPTHIASSRWEKLVRVPFFGQWEWKEEMLDTPHASPLLHSLMEGLLFRKMVGANDTCSHNFVVWKNTAYVIDDRAVEKRTRYMWKKSTMNPAYACWMQKMWPALEAMMERWSQLLENAIAKGEPFLFAQKVLDTMKNQKNWRW